MKRNSLDSTGFHYVADHFKPLCATPMGLLCYHKNSLYLYFNDCFQRIYDFESTLKKRLIETTRFTQRVFRTEPQNAIWFNNMIYLARRDSIDCLSIEKQQIVEQHRFRKPYIHTDRSGLVVITGVPGFDECIAYGEYFSNERKEDVHIFVKPVGKKWEDAFAFPPNTIRHIHSLIPNPFDQCVYVLTGDSDNESGIWRATDNFKRVEPMLVGNQKFRSGVAFTRNNLIIFATDMPSRPNNIATYDIRTGEYSVLMSFPASCTVGCLAKDKMIFCSTYEAEEPKNHGKVEMLRYYFRMRKAAGILDRFPRVFMETDNGMFKEIIKMKKDIWPAALCQFGKILPVYDEYSDTLYIYPVSVEKYDGKLFAIGLDDLQERLNQYD